MTFTFNGDQLVAMIMAIFLAGSIFGGYFEKYHSGTMEELENLDDEIELLQQEILQAEKDKDVLREILYEATAHPAVKHLVNDRRKARGLKPVK